MENVSRNISFSDPKFQILEDGRTTVCTAECRLNLRELERQYMTFTTNFIKNTMSKYIPIVYSVFSFDHKAGANVCRAKYLIKPGCPTATVLRFDADYYRDRVDPSQTERSEVPVSKMVSPRKQCGEFSDYEYTSTIAVSARAVCHELDEFVAETGELVSFSKAVVKINQRITKLFVEIINAAKNLANDLVMTSATLCNSIDAAESYLEYNKGNE